MIELGMLWQDTDEDKSVANKIEEGISYFRAKYGQDVVCVFVHPQDHEGGLERAVKVKVKVSRAFPPGHIWLGSYDPKEETHVPAS